MPGILKAGAAEADITPRDSQFLFGYPHEERYSTGIHDRLLSSSLYLSDGSTHLLFIANDIIFVPKDLAARARTRIARETGIPATHIVTSATHTHSGPITVNYLSNAADPVVPRADPAYLALLEEGIVSAGVDAFRSATDAELGLAVADGAGIGTNRRAPDGPADLDVPVLLVRSRADGKPLACMLVCCMHPTVLHEDSTLVSGDFPAMTRKYLQESALKGCPVVYHTGPEGNQSPRHVTAGNTFAEAERLGTLLGQAVEAVLPRIDFSDRFALAAAQRHVDLPPRPFPSVDEAARNLRHAVERLDYLRRSGAAHAEVRTAECDWFGAEETLTLARAAADGKLEAARQAVMPAEIQVLSVGPWHFAAWPGEMFIEFGLALRQRNPNVFVIALANGELQGYLVTPEAAAEGGYEASNALFAPAGGDILVQQTQEMVTLLWEQGGAEKGSRGKGSDSIKA